MPKLTYWYAQCKEDSEHFSIVTKTKKACEARRKELSEDSYAPPVKRIFEYRDAFDLFEFASGPDGGRGMGDGDDD